jgi:hypothetical protein
MIKIIGFIFIAVFVPSNAWAHSGGTNAEGEIHYSSNIDDLPVSAREALNSK